uniref:Uncharacterized protein n=1 Tax=Panagrolaimus superbus TaxID=310955 RepID=A0A914YRK3_9BILA
MDEKPQKFQLKKWQVVVISLLTLSLLGFAICLTILISLAPLIEKNIRATTYLEPGSSVFEKWLNPHYMLETRMWTYSVKNPDEILNNHKPVVKKQGPYVFDQVHKRKIHSIENSTVKYETFSYYYFNESKSCETCYLYNRVWIPNMIYQKFVEAASKPSMKAATAALLVQTPFLEVEVSEMLFEGYADPFLDQVCSLPFVNFVCESVLDLPDRIGFFFDKNGSTSGVYVVDSGLTDADLIGNIRTWNGQNRVPDGWWSNYEATEIHGTDGTLFNPFLSKEQKITVFVKDLCRSIDLYFKEEIDYKGITAYRYVIPQKELDTTRPENKGYCNENNKIIYPEQAKDCLPPGLIDLSRCQRGEPPIIFSLPNFLYAPKYVQDSVEGLDTPNVENDEIELDFEPRLGSLFRAIRRSQINIAMWRGANLTIPKFRNVIIPVIRIDDIAEMDTPTFDLIKEKLILTERLVRTITITGMATAVILAILTGMLCFYKVR